MDNKNDLSLEDFPYIKNITFDFLSGKYKLIDSKGNNKRCDLFGRRIKKFIKDKSGFLDGEERKNLIQSKSFYGWSDSIFNEISQQQQNHEEKMYYPSISKFEGYNFFPRPLCPPFVNHSSIQLISKNKLANLKTINQNFFSKKNRITFSNDYDFKGLSYLSSCLTCYNFHKKENEEKKMNKSDGKSLIIKKINKIINEYKNKYHLTFEQIYETDRNFRSIIHLKRKLLNNNGTIKINGKKLNEPLQYIINQYKIIDKIIKSKNKRRLNISNNLRGSFKSFEKIGNKINDKDNNMKNSK